MRRPDAIEALAALLAVALAWTYVSPHSFRPREAARETAASDVAAIQAALATYHADSGEYPTTAQGLAALGAEPAAAPRPWNWQGPYVLRPLPRDPWGRPYAYASDGARYALASWGADGRPGGTGDAADLIERR